MAGRRVENQRRQKYGTSSYVSGNTARKLAAAPQRRYEEYDIPKEVEITEEDRIAIRKLGYMMQIVRKYMQSENFEDTRARYSEFPKISFVGFFCDM